MGQQQSSEKPSGHRHSTHSSEKDRKVNRRVSLQALSHAQPVDPSASNANAVAQATTSHNVEKHNLQQMLQSSSPEYASKSSRVERSASRASREKKEPREMETKAMPIRQPPMPVPEVAEAIPQATVPSESIAIPPSSSASAPRHYLDDPELDSRPPYEARSYAPVSQLRPPRLPLPIADAPTPDSPTLAPIDVSNHDVPVIFGTDERSSGLESAMRRRSSFQSEATQDDEEVAEELQPYAVVPPVHTVPTTIEWNQPGERVFVTGTFATWDRKYRLHRRKSGDGMSCVINLPPGTHHLKFWVDNQMLTSDNLPTAVDFNNVLVNYIEISSDDIPKTRRESTAPTARTGPAVHPQLQPPEDSNETYPTGDEVEGMDEPVAEEMPPGDFRAIIPQYLHDIDYTDDDYRYQRAVSVIQDSNAPPSLPMFLNKSLLNGNLPVKDDHSVLTLPNHTVLNHLMTSSVKNGVLATSVTTRYKSKYVTTISFKPVPKFDRK